MSALGIVTGLAETAVSAVRHPFRTTGQIVGGAKTVVTTSTSLAGHTVKSATSHLHPAKHSEQAKEQAKEQTEDPGEEQTAGKTDEDHAPKQQPAARKATAKSKPAQAPKAEPEHVEPQVVLREPAPPLEPPIDVVGEALAAEAQEPTYAGSGHATEPKAASRDEEHGDAALQRAEAEEIAEEMAEAFPAGEVSIETPVGTTGADVAFNPDTAEADLQQPGTEPLVDGATVKAVASAAKTGRKAAAKKKV